MAEILETAQLEGTVEQVLYTNDHKSYVVALLGLEQKSGAPQRITIVGKLEGLEVGAGIRVRGRLERHPRYGEQLRVEDFETLRPAGTIALERYLAGEIKGVGPALARRITAHFGDTLETVLDGAPERLREVRGLGPVVAERIAAAWRDSSGLRELTVFLRAYGVPVAHARRIHQLYGKEAVPAIRQDPYLLARTVSGIGFRSADLLGEKLGIPHNSIQRARAAMLYLLERMAEDGHVFASLGRIEYEFRSALEIDSELAAQAADDLAKSGEVIVEQFGEHQIVYLKRLHQAESNLARRLLRLAASGRPLTEQAVVQALKAARRAVKFNLTHEQEKAVQLALENRLAVVTGGPGTGKTTVMRAVLAALSSLGLRPTFAAPTGRAARRLAASCGRDARTIHRLLEYSPETGDFIRDETFPLHTNYLVVDEASMLDVELASKLLSALAPGSSLLLVGDRDQLPSVGPGSVLKDVIASARVPTLELREVHRQAAQSQIVANAHRLNRGEMPVFSNDPEGDFFFFEREAPEEIVATVKLLLSGRLVGKFGIRDPNDIQVLSPMNRGPLGTQALNRELQELLNPQGPELRSGDRVFRVGDRVLQLRNNYDKSVFNGATGRIISIDSRRGFLTVAFDEGVVEYDMAELGELSHGYAISVHKSQGSQYPAVILALHQSHYLMLRRNLLYTAITRAERVCVLVGTRSAMLQAVRNEDERKRYSRLAERLREGLREDRTETA